MNSKNQQVANTMTISSEGIAAASPVRFEYKEYELYFTPPPVGEIVTFSFDILNFNPLDATQAAIILDQVIVESVPKSVFP
jgi:hypothetical protein